METETMTQLIAGDIGGTKTSLRLVESYPLGIVGRPLPQIVLYEAEYPSQAYGDLTPLVQRFLADAAGQLGRSPSPRFACFAIAGPVVGDRSSLPNLGWELSGQRLAEELHLDDVSLINDFAAVGLGVTALAPEDRYSLQKGEPSIGAPMAVIGAGTGLGQGFLVPKYSGGYQVYATEGGHTDFAPRSALEVKLRDYLMAQRNLTRVSVERVVSGQGIAAIYQFLRDRPGETSPPEHPQIAELVRRWEQQTDYDADLDPGAAISKGANQLGDPLCCQAMEMFMDAYGAEAGNLALKILPYGGLYIAGGVVTKNLDLLLNSSFLRSFLDKGRVSPVLTRIPIHIVMNPQVGLIGAALEAATLLRPEVRRPA
jgi:glucokinase